MWRSCVREEQLTLKRFYDRRLHASRKDIFVRIQCLGPSKLTFTSQIPCNTHNHFSFTDLSFPEGSGAQGPSSEEHSGGTRQKSQNWWLRIDAAVVPWGLQSRHWEETASEVDGSRVTFWRDLYHQERCVSIKSGVFRVSECNMPDASAFLIQCIA